MMHATVIHSNQRSIPLILSFHVRLYHAVPVIVVYAQIKDLGSVSELP